MQIKPLHFFLSHLSLHLQSTGGGARASQPSHGGLPFWSTATLCPMAIRTSYAFSCAFSKVIRARNLIFFFTRAELFWPSRGCKEHTALAIPGRDRSLVAECKFGTQKVLCPLFSTSSSHLRRGMKCSSIVPGRRRRKYCNVNTSSHSPSEPIQVEMAMQLPPGMAWTVSGRGQLHSTLQCLQYLWCHHPVATLRIGGLQDLLLV